MSSGALFTYYLVCMYILELLQGMMVLYNTCHSNKQYVPRKTTATIPLHLQPARSSCDSLILCRTPRFSVFLYAFVTGRSGKESWCKPQFAHVGQSLKRARCGIGMSGQLRPIMPSGCAMSLMIIRKNDLKEIFCEIIRKPYPNVPEHS